MPRGTGSDLHHLDAYACEAEEWVSGIGKEKTKALRMHIVHMRKAIT